MRLGVDGGNLTSLLTEVGVRVHGILMHHIQQFTFSPSGAMRLKADMNAYAECCATMPVPLPSLATRFKGAQAVINLLIVQPESLAPLVDSGSIGMDIKEAMQWIKLRVDYDQVRRVLKPR